jgi:lipopolysaccharide export system permease protein
LKIISRYVVREHLGPFTFALIALTSLMLLNFISRQFGELVGKGLPWSAIGRFFLLSIPFTLALTVPMSVLVAVLYAFSRLASENEVTAMKANGVSPWRLVAPSIVCGVLMSMALLAFNDQVLPEANHQLKTLQDDISQTKPTFFLKEQVINPIAEGKFYLKADKVDQAGGRLKQVVIYDLADPMHRRTIYSDSGKIAFRANLVDLNLDLYDGQMQEVSSDKPTQINRLFFDKDRIRVPNVGPGGGLKVTNGDSTAKGDREMSVCEMQQRLWRAQIQYELDARDLEEVKHPPKPSKDPPKRTVAATPGGLGAIYCGMLKAIGIKTAQAADVDPLQLHAVRDVQQDTVTKKATVAPLDTGAVRRVSPKDSAPGIAALRAQQALARAALAKGAKPARDTNLVRFERQQQAARAAAQAAAAAAAVGAHSVVGSSAAATDSSANASRVIEAKMRLEISQRARDRYVIEINKKFSLAAACLIFSILAPPIALRFPRGGVGLVIGVSLLVFALYYVGLIGGEAAANNGYVPPFWAMWGTNVILTAVGVVMLLRMGKDRGSARGGGLREWLDERRFLREEKRAAAAKRSHA